MLAPLVADPVLTGEALKTVTVVFCDVVGSTPLGEQLDPESVRRVMARFYDRTSRALERHGGTVSKYIGDAVMAVFGIPSLHEDDALRAVRAAVEMRAELASLNDELRRDVGVALRVRTGINTGSVVVGDPALGDALVVGDAVNVAARLEQAAAPDEIVIGPDTYALVRGSVVVDEGSALTLRGRAEPVRGYRVVGVDADPGRQDRLRPPFVGRGAELARLGTAFERSSRERTCVLLTVLGAAGIGKSRLVEEFRASLTAPATIVGGRCLPYGEGITFWPVAEAVKEACGVTDRDPRDVARDRIERTVASAPDATLVAETVEAVLGVAETKASIQETFWAIRRFFEVLATDRPLVVVFDDIHWAEPTFLDLLEYLAGHARDAALLVVCVARPDLLDLRPTWTSVGDDEVVHLAGLDAEEGERLLEHLAGEGALGPSDVAHLVEAAGGNPLFLEEMFRMLEDEGLLARDGERWRVVGDLASVAVPASIQALLGARIDRLAPNERTVLGTASVMGTGFWWGAVAELAPEAIRPAVGGSLQTLVRKGLIVPARSTLAGEDAFAFHHGLVQDATYRAVPKERRAELHEGFAGWIERRAGDRGTEYEEVIGYHLEQASRYRAELGSVYHAARIGVRAAERLRSAGRRALARGDMPGAVSLL